MAEKKSKRELLIIAGSAPQGLVICSPAFTAADRKMALKPTTRTESFMVMPPISPGDYEQEADRLVTISVRVLSALVCAAAREADSRAKPRLRPGERKTAAPGLDDIGDDCEP